MHSRRAGGHDHPVDGEAADILFDKILARIRAKITVVPGYLDPRKGAGKLGKFITINGGSNIGATVTDIDTDILFHYLSFSTLVVSGESIPPLD